MRGEKAIAWARKFLDESVPLSGASWSDVQMIALADGALALTTVDGKAVKLKKQERFAGYLCEVNTPTHFLLKHNGIDIGIIIAPFSPIGKADISDVRVESAITAIMDCDDSLAAVDAEDKVAVYRNWLGRMTGHLTNDKADRTFTRSLPPDITRALGGAPQSWQARGSFNRIEPMSLP